MEYENADQPQWYVAHTYSGYENKVKDSIEATVEHRNMQDVIFEVQVPVQDVVEQKDGKKVVKEKKLFPGYVIVKMFMTDESWYVVRNTRGVTGFVGPASKPVPLSEDELRKLGIRRTTYKVDFEVGDKVKVLSGPFENCAGEVTDINAEQGRLTANLEMFGRETPTELEFDQVEKLNA